MSTLSKIGDYLSENGLGLLGGVAASVATGNPAPLIAKIASTLGVSSTAEAIEDELSKNNPETLLKLKQLESEERRELIRMGYEHDAQNLSTVNETYRAEINQDDKYVKRWRPTMGYAVTFTWVITWMGMVWVMIWETEKASQVITAMAGTAMMWSVALAILGVAVHKRSQDKEVAAGFEPKSITSLFKK